jgi:hypothetical protein
MKIVFGGTPSCTGRGEFTDVYGQKCIIQPSSSAEGARIWLGAVDAGPHLKEVGTMHLDRSTVAALLPHLQAFVNTGSLTATKEAVNAAHAIEAREALADELHQAAANLESEGWAEVAVALRTLADPPAKV